MFKKLNQKNKKGQNTAEYALLISLVVAAIIAMQTYAQRTLQARIRDASLYLTTQTTQLGTTQQYEPYYLETQYTITRDSEDTTRLGNQLIGYNAETNRERADQGFQVQKYSSEGGTTGF